MHAALGAAGRRPAPLAAAPGGANARNFVARRDFAANPAFAPFVNNGWNGGYAGYAGWNGGYGGWNGGWTHLGWIGPLFWPYGYGDMFYAALWPYEYGYVDPVWAYGYNDIYEGIFFPYDYQDLVEGPQAQARMTSLTQGMSEACVDSAAEVTAWPIDQIQQAVQPNDRQRVLLDDLSNAIVKASELIKSQCPATVAFTPVDRLTQMQERLQALLQAVNIISPPLNSFYDSLSDEQKARFNEIGTPGSNAGAQNEQATNSAHPQTSCSGKVLAWPTDQINRVVQPTQAQERKLEALQSAAAQAAGIIKAACPSETPSTPPSRLEAEAKHLQAMVQAVQMIEPPLRQFYASLSDDQKARFDTMGPQVVAVNR